MGEKDSFRSDTKYKMADTLKDRIRRALSLRKNQTIVDKGLKPSGVLLPVFFREEKHHILFTKRTENVEHHKGQISFPGGAYEDGDGALMNTALRETYEEIGLKGEDVEILGELDDVVTKTQFIISPFVGLFSYPYKFKTSAVEIDELIEVPIEALLDKNIFREELCTRKGKPYPVYFYEYNEHVIWGATAKILKQFLDLVF